MTGLKDLSDRELLVSIATKQEAFVDKFKTVDKDVDKLEAEDTKLHHRINETHGRINTIKFWSAGFAAVGSAIGSFIGFITGGRQ